MTVSVSHLEDYRRRGWCRFPFDPVLKEWVDRSMSAIHAAIAAPENAQWMRYQGTWFAGVNVLANDDEGAVPGGLKLAGTAIDFVVNELKFSGIPWDRAQVSVCYPGYPKPMADESDALHRFRKNRDAAHVDGLLRVGPDRRRFLKEHHAFILGIPVSEFSEDASPFTIWEGSHRHVGAAFQEWFGTLPSSEWGDIDITDRYQALRKTLFETCVRVPVHARPGEAFLVHRHALHGMAPWGDAATAGPNGRAIVYFRPPVLDLTSWLDQI